jgi:hypothetical protein
LLVAAALHQEVEHDAGLVHEAMRYPVILSTTSS